MGEKLEWEERIGGLGQLSFGWVVCSDIRPYCVGARALAWVLCLRAGWGRGSNLGKSYGIVWHENVMQVVTGVIGGVIGTRSGEGECGDMDGLVAISIGIDYVL